MSKITLRTAVLAALLVGLVALPALAQPNVPPGKDFWVTPANGQTFFTFPAGDVEALCGAPVSATWNHVVTFTGVNLSTSTVTAYDTMIARLDNAVFNTNGVATTRVQVQALSFRSTATTSTPCGPLNWNAGLAGVQNTSQMTIRRTSATGGVFFAELFINAELQGVQRQHRRLRRQPLLHLPAPRPGRRRRHGLVLRPRRRVPGRHDPGQQLHRRAAPEAQPVLPQLLALLLHLRHDRPGAVLPPVIGR